MKIETNTRPVDLLEVLGDQASMLDAAIFLEVLRNEGVQNTEDVSAHQWERMVAKSERLLAIPKAAWKLLERAHGESIAVCTTGRWEGMEMAMDWTQGLIMPPTKQARLSSLIGDLDLVSRHQALFLGLEE